MRTTAALALLLFATVAVTACSDDDDASPSASPTVGVSAKASFAGFPTPTDPSAPLPTPEPATALPTPVPVVTSDNGLPYYEDSTGLSFNYPAGVLSEAKANLLERQFLAINPAKLQRRIETALRVVWACTERAERRKVG